MAKYALITFPEERSNGTFTKDYPLCVVVIDDAPGAKVPRSQEYLVRSASDGQILANGIHIGARRALPYGTDDWEVNPRRDERLKFRD